MPEFNRFPPKTYALGLRMLACMIECEWYVKAQKRPILYPFGHFFAIFGCFFIVLSGY